jgi:uncharacterized protein (TIGR00251 family)
VKAVLRVRVVPNAKRSQIAGLHGEAIKIKIQAPARDGKANAALLNFIAERLGLPSRQVTLVAGDKSRDKIVAIDGIEQADVCKRLQYGQVK